jgi:hypothetical protein
MRILLFALSPLAVAVPAAATPPGDTAETTRLAPCHECASAGWPVSLLPGELRMALPSPDGTRLAVFGGPGTPGREHTVLVLQRDCGGRITHLARVSGSAVYREPPVEIPALFITLRWSDDGNYLFAGDSAYRLALDENGELRVDRLRTFREPFFDIRFGPKSRAAGVAYLDSEWKVVHRGESEDYLVTMEYRFMSLNREIDSTIQPKEKFGKFWIVSEGDPPALQWRDDGSLLVFYPLNSISETIVPGGARKVLRDVRPQPAPEPGAGPFRYAEPCPGEWRLASDDSGDRVHLVVP